MLNIEQTLCSSVDDGNVVKSYNIADDVTFELLHYGWKLYLMAGSYQSNDCANIIMDILRLAILLMPDVLSR